MSFDLCWPYFASLNAILVILFTGKKHWFQWSVQQGRVVKLMTKKARISTRKGITIEVSFALIFVYFNTISNRPSVKFCRPIRHGAKAWWRPSKLLHSTSRLSVVLDFSILHVLSAYTDVLSFNMCSEIAFVNTEFYASIKRTVELCVECVN